MAQRDKSEYAYATSIILDEFCEKQNGGPKSAVRCVRDRADVLLIEYFILYYRQSDYPHYEPTMHTRFFELFCLSKKTDMDVRHPLVLSIVINFIDEDYKVTYEK